MAMNRVQLSRWAGFAAVLLMTTWVLVQGVAVLRSDWHSASLRQDIEGWSSGRTPYDPARWVAAHAELKAAIAATPDHALLHEMLAQLHSVRGQAEWGDGDADSPGVAQFQEAVAAQERAVALRPRYPFAWANLAYYHYALRASGDLTFAAWDKALALGPNEAPVRAVLMDVAKFSWPETPEHVKAWLEQVEPGAGEKLEAELIAEAQREQAEADEARLAEEAEAREREREAALARAAENARKPAFQSRFNTPAEVQLPR